MLCAPDNFLLQLWAQVIKIVAVPGHPHNQILVFLRVLLGIPKRISRYYIELDMVTIHPEITSDKLSDLTYAPLILEKFGCELLVEQGATGLQMIYLQCGIKNSCGAVSVHALEG